MILREGCSNYVSFIICPKSSKASNPLKIEHGVVTYVNIIGIPSTVKKKLHFLCKFINSL